MLRRRSCLILALSSFLAVPLLAQTATPVNPGVPAATLRVNARSVVVDVVVTDRNNKAVTGLPREEFQVFEDGKPQAITFFEQHAGTPAGAPAEPAPPLPPNTFTNIPSALPTDAVDVLLMDAQNTPMENQVYVHKEMVKYLSTIPPGIRIGIFLLSNRLRIVQGFTEDSSALRMAIERSSANPTPSALLATPAETAANSNAVTLVGSMGPAGNAQSAASASALQSFLAEQSSFQTNMRTEGTLDALQEIARYLAGIPGRKNLMWFATNLQLCMFARDTVDCPYYDKMKKTLDMLTNAQVSLYPIDASGLDGGFDGGDLSVAPIQMQSSMQATTAYSRSLHSASRDRNHSHLVMDQLAWDTGGKASYNQNGLKESLAEDIDNGSRYYTLAYTPTNLSEKGKERKIEVKLASGKYKLAYRRSYIEDTPKEVREAEAVKAKDPLRPLMDRGMPNFTELRYRLHVEPATPQPAADAARAGSNALLKGPLTRYGIDFTLTAEGVFLDTAPDGVRHGMVEATVVAYSAEGRPMNWMVRFFGLVITPAQYEAARKSGIPFHLDIDVPPGNIYLRTGIYDTLSSKAGTLEIPLSAITLAAK
jgi:VWFA-related protein